MGAGVFNGRVRDGIGFWARRSGHQTGATQFVSDGAVQGAATAGVRFGKLTDSRSAGGVQRLALRVSVATVSPARRALRLPVRHGHGSRERSSLSGD